MFCGNLLLLAFYDQLFCIKDVSSEVVVLMWLHTVALKKWFIYFNSILLHYYNYLEYSFRKCRDLFVGKAFKNFAFLYYKLWFISFLMFYKCLSFYSFYDFLISLKCLFYYFIFYRITYLSKQSSKRNSKVLLLQLNKKT